MLSSLLGKLDVARFLVESKADLDAKANGYYPYNTTFQIAHTTVSPFKFSNFYFQWLDSAHVDLLLWKT